ncbi:hypothetical protein IWZ03DRAFT_122082 [Phyllosticta citriasiana]|uniref:Uncharacterized protein n=1 Tax=Phyllosticta citriasiana TaxID=595635 RepID=A0ABR1K7F6_9PEZI
MSSGARSDLELSYYGIHTVAAAALRERGGQCVLFPLLRCAARIEKQKRSTLAVLWLVSYRQRQSNVTLRATAPHAFSSFSSSILTTSSHRSRAALLGTRRVLTNWKPQYRNNSDNMRLSQSARRCLSAAPAPKPQPRGRFRRPGKSCLEGENSVQDRRRCCWASPLETGCFQGTTAAAATKNGRIRAFWTTMTASSRLATMMSGAVDGFRPSILCSLNVATCTHAILIAAVIIHGVDGAPHPMLSGRWEWPRKIVRWHASFKRNQWPFIISLSVPLLLMIRRAA